MKVPKSVLTRFLFFEGVYLGLYAIMPLQALYTHWWDSTWVSVYFVGVALFVASWQVWLMVIEVRRWKRI